MFHLTTINQCCHVFDTELCRFVRSSTKNLHKALGPASANQTRREMLTNLTWQLCQDSHCKALHRQKQLRNPVNADLGK